MLLQHKENKFMESNHQQFVKRIDAATWRSARAGLDKALRLHLHDPNVCHIDLGLRIRGSNHDLIEPELCVRIHVLQKLTGDAFDEFSAHEPDRIFDPLQIGFPVDVIQAEYDSQILPESDANILGTLKRSPVVRGGLVISNAVSSSIGTLGGLVRDRRSGEIMILSTWDALAGSWRAKQGIPIYQPRQISGDPQLNIVAHYARSALAAKLDAAVARLNPRKSIRNDQSGIGPVTGSVKPRLGMRVVKSGGWTSVTSGIITGISGYSHSLVRGHQLRHWPRNTHHR